MSSALPPSQQAVESPILAAMERSRRALLRRDLEASTRLISAYGEIWKELQRELQAATPDSDPEGGASAPWHQQVEGTVSIAEHHGPGHALDAEEHGSGCNGLKGVVESGKLTLEARLVMAGQGLQLKLQAGAGGTEEEPPPKPGIRLDPSCKGIVELEERLARAGLQGPEDSLCVSHRLLVAHPQCLEATDDI